MAHMIVLLDTGSFEVCTLHDSDTNEELTTEDLGVSDEAYADLVRLSFATGTAEGHIRLDDGRRVYAFSEGRVHF